MSKKEQVTGLNFFLRENMQNSKKKGCFYIVLNKLVLNKLAVI